MMSLLCSLSFLIHPHATYKNVASLEPVPSGQTYGKFVSGCRLRKKGNEREGPETNSVNV